MADEPRGVVLGFTGRNSLRPYACVNDDGDLLFVPLGPNTLLAYVGSFLLGIAAVVGGLWWAERQGYVLQDSLLRALLFIGTMSGGPIVQRWVAKRDLLRILPTLETGTRNSILGRRGAFALGLDDLEAVVWKVRGKAVILHTRNLGRRKIAFAVNDEARPLIQRWQRLWELRRDLHDDLEGLPEEAAEARLQKFQEDVARLIEA